MIADWIWATIQNVLVILQFLFPGGVGWGGGREEKRRGEKRREDKRREEERREEKRIQEKRREEKRIEDKTRKEKRIEQNRREEKRKEKQGKARIARSVVSGAVA